MKNRRKSNLRRAFYHTFKIVFVFTVGLVNHMTIVYYLSHGFLIFTLIFL